MKDGEKDLIAQLLLESRTGAFIEWLANDLIMTAIHIYKDSLLVMLFEKKETQQTIKLITSF